MQGSRTLGAMAALLVLLGCQRDTPRDLFGKEWTLVELNGNAVSLQKPPTIQLSAEPKSVTGFGGCNRLTGSYTLDQGRLRFGPIAMTRMACAEGMDTEQALTTALGAVQSFRVMGASLQLLGESGNVLARFTSP
jgi:heat shock protein HslJ